MVGFDRREIGAMASAKQEAAGKSVNTEPASVAGNATALGRILSE
jgi:hypothetical protein